MKNASIPFRIPRSSPQSLPFSALTCGVSLSRKKIWLSSCKNRFGFPNTGTDYSPSSHTLLRSPKAENIISAAGSWGQIVSSLLFWTALSRLLVLPINKKLALDVQRMTKLGIYLPTYILIKLTCDLVSLS